jgi:hypothetical protein
VTAASNNRRLLEVTAKYEVNIQTTNDSDSATLETVTTFLQNVTDTSKQPSNVTDLVWCGDFCQKHESIIAVDQTGGYNRASTPDLRSKQHRRASPYHADCAL